MESPLLSIPVEILCRIFELCSDFPQVVALASACKHTQTVWVTNSPNIIWTVGQSQIRSFSDALMVVRATAIVLKAYQAGTLPPAIVSMKSLSGNFKLPDLAELKEVLNMQHLVRCVEYRYFNSQYNMPRNNTLFEWGRENHRPRSRNFSDRLKENVPGAEKATIHSFRDGFFRAMYRLLLAGAVLARAYMAPVFQAREERNTVFYLVYGHNDYWSEDLEALERVDRYPQEADLAYIRQFPVYNFDVSDSNEIGQWRNREYEDCFGPFTSWIVEDGRMRERNEPQDMKDTAPDWAENRLDIGAVRELMLLLVAYEHCDDSFRNCYKNDSPYLQKQGNRTVSIIRFGHFNVEKITMPAAFEDLTDTPLVAEHHPALEGTAGEDIKYQLDFDQAMFYLDQKRRTDIPWHRRYPEPPPTLELWRFALRHYLNLTFKPGAFATPKEYWNALWWREVYRGDIFMNSNWNIVQTYDPNVITWDYQNYQVS